MLSFYPEEGLQLFTIKVNIVVDGSSIGHFLLIPHSEQMYEIHLSPIEKKFRGWTTEISRHALHYGFKSMSRLEKLIAVIPVHNRLAIKVAKGCGMVEEGLIKKSFLFMDKLEDQVIYGISKEDVCQ